MAKKGLTRQMLQRTIDLMCGNQDSDTVQRRVMAIEFRVQGTNSNLVAEQLAVLVKSMFDVEATVRKAPMPANSDEGLIKVRGFVEVTVLIVHVAIIAHAAYDRYVEEPYDKAVAKWRELVLFAKEKRPTLIQAVIGEESVSMHESDPERLHKLTRNVIEIAIVDLNSSPGSQDSSNK